MISKKILYVVFSVLVIVIIIAIWNGKESLKIQSVSGEAKSEQVATQQQGALSEYAEQLPSASRNKPAITMIKPRSEEETNPPIGETAEKIEKSQQAKSQATSVSPDATVSEEASEDSSAGITKINKRPTEIESKEMNARGIVMY